MADTDLHYQHNGDQVAGDATITVNTGTEDTAYPKANLVDGDPAKPAKLTGTTGSWVFDFGSAQRVDLIAIIMHNLDAGLSVKIQGNASDSWGGPTLDEAVTIQAYALDDMPENPWLDLTDKTGYSTGGFRYWRLVIVGTNTDAVAVGEVWLGSLKRVLSPNISWGVRKPQNRPVISHETSGIARLVYDRGVRTRDITGELETTDAGALLIENWWVEARGSARAVLVILDGTVNDARLMHFVEEPFSQELLVSDNNRLDLEFRELSRGRPL